MHWVSKIVFFVLLYYISQGKADSVWQSVQVNWTNPAVWKWVRYGYDTTIPSRVFATPEGQMRMYYDPNNVYSNPGFAGPIYLRQAYGPGSKAFYVEWNSNSNSATVIELLSEQLMSVGQFSSQNCWPNCGEIDVYEMLLQPNIQSPNYGSPRNYGKMTLHKGARNNACSCPSRGGTQTWYKDTPPMSSACAAEFASKLGQTNSMVTIFDEDNFGQFIQFIQNPVLTDHPDGTTTISIGPSSTATWRIYNNQTEFYGTAPANCPQGNPGRRRCPRGLKCSDPATGWPFYNQAMHLIVWEQDYTANSGITGDTLGEFMITNIRVWVPGTGTSGQTSSSSSGQTSSGQTSVGSTSDTASVTSDANLHCIAFLMLIISLLL